MRRFSPALPTRSSVRRGLLRHGDGAGRRRADGLRRHQQPGVPRGRHPPTPVPPQQGQDSKIQAPRRLGVKTNISQCQTKGEILWLKGQ